MDWEKSLILPCIEYETHPKCKCWIINVTKDSALNGRNCTRETLQLCSGIAKTGVDHRKTEGVTTVPVRTEHALTQSGADVSARVNVGTVPESTWRACVVSLFCRI
ncbi:hypothetical protein J6590_036637 [Homalodisca vitripennis]|nr:hypothetical protein J6590_036637 [Homalodisca vitripennis]